MDVRSSVNYSTIEYLCKNVKAKKGLPWVLSLRKEVEDLPRLSYRG